MSLSDISHLKNLSWYATVPLLVCAWLLQENSVHAFEISSLWDLVSIVASYFGKVIAGLFVAYSVWFFASVYIDKDGIFLTLVFATFLLTLSAVGFGIYIMKPAGIALPINILWFAACGSVAFNLYQIQNSVLDEKSKST